MYFFNLEIRVLLMFSDIMFFLLNEYLKFVYVILEEWIFLSFNVIN